MSLREEQCKKVCRILDDVLANRPTERDSLIVAVRKAFESLEQFGNSEPLPSAQPERKKGKWIYGEDEYGIDGYHCDKCGFFVPWDYTHKFIDFIKDYHFCPNCGARMDGDSDAKAD